MSEKIYLLEEPDLFRYARFSHVGTWSAGKLCNSCGQPSSRLTAPLLIEWEQGADEIGDFSWCGYTSVIRANVRDFLILNNVRCEFGDVEVVQPTAKKKKPTLWPYNGPELFWLIPLEYIELDEMQSGVSVEVDCPVCKQKKYGFRRSGLVFDKKLLGNTKIFKVKQFNRSAATFVTEIAMQEMKSFGFTNVTFLEAGEAV